MLDGWWCSVWLLWHVLTFVSRQQSHFFVFRTLTGIFKRSHCSVYELLHVPAARLRRFVAFRRHSAFFSRFLRAGRVERWSNVEHTDECATGSPALLMPGFSCAQGVCLACNASSVSTGNVTGNATGVSLGNGTLIALDPATSSSFSGCSINPSQCADAGLVYEVWIPRPGCTNLLGSRKSVFCAAASLGSMAAVVAAAVVAIVALL